MCTIFILCTTLVHIQQTYDLKLNMYIMTERERESLAKAYAATLVVVLENKMASDVCG